MCGIVGCIDFQERPISLNASLDSMKNRGPDDVGEWFSADKKVALGHRRLAIVDLSSAGRQPILNEDGTMVLVCNGEIYNYQLLRNELEKKGHTFKSRSDSEVILHAYENWGEDCLAHLEGMFAFIIWDNQAKKIFAARDRLGIKPLYYTHREGRFVLASVLGGLLPVLSQKPDINFEGFSFVLAMGYIPSPMTIWDNIWKLEAGHYLVLKAAI